MEEAEAQMIARRVREELARRRMSRQALADMARVSISTLEKALSGRRAFTLATVIRLEQALGVPLQKTRSDLPADSPIASPDNLGAYSQNAVRWLEGRYLTLRPSFGTPGDIFAYVTIIQWDTERGHLMFSEAERLDSSFSQNGKVSLPHLSGHIYLVTNVEGQYRLAVLGRPTIQGALYGILTTLMVGHGSQLIPAAAPFVLLRLKAESEIAFGRITADDPDYVRYRAELDLVTADGFANFPK